MHNSLNKQKNSKINCFEENKKCLFFLWKKEKKHLNQSFVMIFIDIKSYRHENGAFLHVFVANRSKMKIVCSVFLRGFFFLTLLKCSQKINFFPFSISKYRIFMREKHVFPALFRRPVQKYRFNSRKNGQFQFILFSTQKINNSKGTIFFQFV